MWNLINTFENVDYANDICLLCHVLQDIIQKLQGLTEEAKEARLKIITNKAAMYP